MYPTNFLSKFMHSPSQRLLSVAKRVHRYIKGTVDFGIFFSKEIDDDLIGYLDSGWVEV